MLTFIADTILALILGVLFIFVTLLGERYKFRVQRGWYVIIVAFFLMWLGSILELANGFYPSLSAPIFQDVIKFGIGQVGGPFLLLLGMLLWAPRVAASREAYLLRIKTSEYRYRMLAEKASDMLAEYDLEGRLLFVTPGAQRIVGYEPNELEGHSIYEFIHPEQQDLVEDEHQAILTRDEPVTSVYKFKHRDGHFIWLESMAQRYIFDDSKGEERILSMSRDVSTRIQYENALRDLNQSLQIQKKRFQLLYEFSTSTHLSGFDQFDSALATAGKALGLGLGIISHIKEQEYEVVSFYSESEGLTKGQIFDLSDTYCSITIQNMDVVAIDKMSKSEYSQHPCWNLFHLESYIGVPVMVRGEVYGTLTFSDASSREAEFSDEDKDFIRLMGQWVSRVLEREQITQELQQSEERYKTVINSAVVGVILIDTSGKIRAFNSAAETIFGYSADEIIGRSVRLLMHDSEYAANDELIETYLKTLLTQFMGTTSEVAATTKNGRVIHIEMGVSEVLTESQHYYSGTVMDISGRKKVETALANAHLRLKNVFESATQIAIITTNLTGEIDIFNPGAERLLGYTAEEVIGHTTQLFHLNSEIEERAQKLGERLGREVEGQEAFFALAKLGGQSEQEWTYIRKDGSFVTVNSAVTALYDTGGDITGFLGIILDISSWKRAEEALKLAKTIAEEANRTKSEFLANMSHELRTPLNSVIGFSNILLQMSAPKLGEKEVVYLERILSNGKHLLELINNILDLSKIEADKMELEIIELNIGEQVNEILDLLEDQANRKSIEFKTIIPENLGANLVDPGKLKQVLLNLLSNAIKFTEAGSITVRLIRNEKENNVSEIHVTDTGIGIPPDRLDTIFDEFAQVDSSTQRKYGGTGLGLSISRRICELMGCQLIVESTVGKGSTFLIKALDHASSQAGSVSERRLADGKRSAKRRQILPQNDCQGRRILIVDDEEDSRTLLSLYLAETGCVLEVAQDAQTAMAAIQKEKPDLITLDIRMPEMGGEDFLKVLQSNPETRDIPIIIVSVIAREKRGKLPGIVEYVQKPVHQQQLLWAVKRKMHRGQHPVLLVEENSDLRLLLNEIGFQDSFEIHSAQNQPMALEILETSALDLIIIDLSLPGLKGQSLIKALGTFNDFKLKPVIVIAEKPPTATESLLYKTAHVSLLHKGDNMKAELKRVIQEMLKA